MILRVVGNSMEPFLPEGARVAAWRTSICPGDVVVARGTDGTLIVHRCIKITDGKITLQGDNLPRPDPPISAAQTVGVVYAVEFSAGKWRRLPRPTGRWALRLAGVRPGILRRALLHLLAAWDHRMAPHIHRGIPKTLAPMLPPRRTSTLPRFEYQEIGLEVAVYDTTTGAVHFLNPTAAHILRRLNEGALKETIAQELSAQYPEVGLDRTALDVANCVSQLQDKELISLGKQGPNDDGTG